MLGGHCMNKQVLWEKINRIGHANADVDAALLRRFGEVLESLEGWDRLRINPLAFAERYAFADGELIPLFLYGVKAGLFDLNWHLICPLCGGVEHSFGSLNLLEMDQFHCTLCNVDIETELDSIIEVSFQLHPDVAKLDVDPHENYWSYASYYISRNFVFPSELIQFIQSRSRAEFLRVPPKGVTEHIVTVHPGDNLRLVSFDNHLEIKLHVGSEQAAEGCVVEAMLDHAHVASGIQAPIGTFTLRLHNPFPTMSGVILLRGTCQDFHSDPELPQPTFRPFLSGKMLLNNQKFRAAFLVENVPNDLKLRLSDLTVLFTDLKGSTELYEKTGDILAYKLVQEHFQLLTEVVAEHHGATVKTMGDALMASFSTPRDGVHAALQMIERMRAHNADIGLKIGVHCGSALAVKANETVDFFGQTVNTAAHVQSKAAAGEIWLTQRVREADGVEDLLRDGLYTEEQHTVLLKGAQKESVVFRCSSSIK